MNGCEYCRDEEPLHYKKTGNVRTDECIGLDDGDILVDVPNTKRIYIEINFCPMCGRKLEEE